MKHSTICGLKTRKKTFETYSVKIQKNCLHPWKATLFSFLTDLAYLKTFI